MNPFLPPLEPYLDAALRDVRAVGVQARVAAAERLGRPDALEMEEAHQGLLTLMRDTAAQVRGAAVHSVALFARAEDHDALVGMLKDTSPIVRELSVMALAAIEHPKRDDALLAALDHPKAEVRFQAILACGELCPARASDKLIELSREGDPRIRQSAARALIALSEDEGPAHARLVALLADKHPEVRWAAALALATHGHRQAFPELLSALEDPRRRVEAVQALAAYTSPEAIHAVTGLAKAALKPPLFLAAAGRTLLAQGQREEAIAALRRALRALRGEGRNHAVETIVDAALHELAPELVRLSRRPRGVDPELLLQALVAIAPRSDAAIQTLQELARKPSADGQAAAAALGDLRSEPADDPETAFSTTEQGKGA